MKQVIQSFKSGELSVTEVPPPSLRSRGILVRTGASLVSAGTERMVVDFAEKNMLAKARARPDLVRQVVDKAQREGVVPTIESVRNRLDQPLAMGYSSAGVVTAVGREVAGLQVGDRVACAGAGYASHAEQVYIPRNLAVRIPDSVTFEAAAFGTIGAIAMQGIRQAEVTLGSQVAVIGLGLVGQVTVQLLKAAGCQVFGIDLNPQRVELAAQLGADATVTNSAAVDQGNAFTGGHGFDAVLITADTRSNEPVLMAGELARDRAIVVAVGAVGLDIERKHYYEKELDFRLSRSYGPGRYDLEYEEKGHDYPYGYVRWTEQRNIEAFIQLVAQGKVDVAPLVSHSFSIDEATYAYDVITGKTSEPFMAVVLSYDMGRELPDSIELKSASPPVPAALPPGDIGVGVLGAGNFVNSTLLPAMKDIPGVDLVGIVSGSGMTARTTAEKFDFRYCASDESRLLDDLAINWVVVATRHDLHAKQTIAALDAGKNVFVEKPLALNRNQLVEIARAQRQTGRQVMVGFNRRFAPMVHEMKEFLAGHHRPLLATYRVNAGAIPRDHWTHDPDVGGGRIIGEACHFIDLLGFLVGAPIRGVQTTALKTTDGHVDDEVLITLTFEDGSVGAIVYAGGGDKAYGKERIEVIGDGQVATLDDFRHLTLVHNGKRIRRTERIRPRKGHRAEWEAMANAARTGARVPIPFDEIVNTHLATFAAVASLRDPQSITLDIPAFWADVETE